MKNKSLIFKKIAFSTLLFFVLSGIFLPNTSLALNMASPKSFGCSSLKSAAVLTSIQLVWDATRNLAVPYYSIIKNGKLIYDEVSKDSSLPQPEREKSYSEKCTEYIYSYIVAWAGNGISEVGHKLAVVMADVFDHTVGNLVVDNTGKWAITNSSNPDNFLARIFIKLWGLVKDWANMLIVLGFIGVALAFIFNLDQYKKLLAPLLIIALLINFSNVFVGLVIDASSIVMASFISGGSLNSGGVGANLVSKINKNWNDALRHVLVTDIRSAMTYFALSVFSFIIYFSVAISLSLFATIFTIRYVALAILFIFSPLAFVLRIIPFPQAQKLWGDWWQKLIKWSFVGLSGAFFLRLATDVMEGFQKFFLTAPISSPEISETVVVGSMAEMFSYILIVELFLLVGIWFTLKSNPLINIILAAVAAIASAIITGGTSLLVGAAGVAGKGAMALGSKGAWKNIGSKAKSVIGTVTSAPFKGSNWAAMGSRLKSGASALGKKETWQSAGSAIYQTGAAAASAVRNAPYKETWGKGLALAKEGLVTEKDSTLESIKTGGRNVKEFVKGGGIGTTVEGAVGTSADYAVRGMGTALRGAGVVLSGKTNVKATMSDWITKLGEWSGTVDEGTVDVNQLARNRKRVEEPLQRYKAVQENRGSLGLFNMRRSSNSPEERAAIDTILAQNNALHLIGDKEEQQGAMDNAMKFGISGREFTKNNADLRDVKKMRENEIRYTKDVEDGKMSSLQARTKAIIDTQSSNFASMKIEDIENMSHEDVAREAREKTARGAKFLQEAIKRKILKMVNDDFKVTGELITESVDNYRSNALKDAIKIDPRYKALDERAVDEAMPDVIAKHGGLIETGQARREAGRMAVIKEVGKISPSKMEDLPTEAFNLEFAEGTTAKKLEEADARGYLSNSAKAELKKLLGKDGELAKVGKAAVDDKDEKRAEELRKIYFTIQSL